MTPDPDRTHLTHLVAMMNRLLPGRRYRATTSTGTRISGEYLGTEVTHGDWAILLRSGTGTASIPCLHLATVTAV